MGHERLPGLPKTQKWRDIFQQVGGTSVSDTAGKTIQNVRSRFRNIRRDNGVLGAFQFLVNLAVASRAENPQERLLDVGIELPDNPTPLSFAKAVNAFVAPKRDSLEYSEIAQRAAGDAISRWYNENQPIMASLFKSLEDPFEVWRKAGNGAGFCELSRLFFAKFTQRYLEYFLEREASAALEAVLKLLGEKKRVEKAYSSVQIQVMQITLKRKDKDEYAKAISDKCHPSAMATADPLAAQTQMAKRWLWTSTCQFATSVHWHPVSDEDRLPMAYAASYLWLLANRVWLFQSLAKARCF